ncbi:hypothetical protein ACN28I_45590 [Archangium gephyra]|uniref:hypothetical protein n=1 Tax=Archangium gephyra TaxID=48 RepID=UPI003B79AC6B
MFENTSKGAQPEESDEDSENQHRMLAIVVHLLLLGVVAVVAASTAVGLSRGSASSMLPMSDASFGMLGLSFAVYAVISSLGVICWRSVTAVFGMHVAAVVLSVPAVILLLLLGSWLLGLGS